MRTLLSVDRPTPVIPTKAAAEPASFSPPVTVMPTRSAWHSPVPYLFGGLAAMLGLIAFALMILACSYWKLSGREQNQRGQESGERDLESGGEKDHEGSGSSKVERVYEEKILVIMAGDENPTFLATPAACCSSKVSCFSDGLGMVNSRNGERVETGDQKAKEMEDHEDEENSGENQNHHTETQPDQSRT